MPTILKADGIRNVGTAEIISAIAIIAIRCVCAKREVIVGQMGMNLVCPTCKKMWFASATSKIEVREVLIDLNKIPDAHILGS